MVFRYGGEEFAVVLPETDKPGAIAVAERMRETMSLTRFLDSKVMPTRHLTISIGVCTFPTDAQNFQELIEIADKHLYSAKRSGRDKVCFSNEGGGNETDDDRPEQHCHIRYQCARGHAPAASIP